MKLRVINETWGGYYQNDFDPSDYSGFTDEYTSNNIRALQAVGTRKDGRHEWHDFETDLPVKVGDELYLLYVVYSTGSTFGRASGRVKYVDVFLTREEAREAEMTIRKDDREGKDRYEIPYTNNGVKKKMWADWKGYFEAIEDTDVRCLEILPKGYYD